MMVSLAGASLRHYRTIFEKSDETKIVSKWMYTARSLAIDASRVWKLKIDTNNGIYGVR